MFIYFIHIFFITIILFNLKSYDLIILLFKIFWAVALLNPVKAAVRLRFQVMISWDQTASPLCRTLKN